ncbi:TPA: hypothetical protein ACIJOI_005270, partial [Raoultella ornithinolytica]
HVINLIIINYECHLNDLGGLFNSRIMRDAAMCVRIYTGFEDGEISLRYTNGSEPACWLLLSATDLWRWIINPVLQWHVSIAISRWLKALVHRRKVLFRYLFHSIM